MRLTCILIAFIGLACIHAHRPKTNIKKLDTTRKSVQKHILGIHNYFRSIVDPHASDMTALQWSSEAANMAISWAQKCTYEHSPKPWRKSEKFRSCGENISYSTRHVQSWYHTLRGWFVERDDFTYDKPFPTDKKVGHYTALVWANTTHVGCGVAFCTTGTKKGEPKENFFNYVCNYCPSGNINPRKSIPYKLGHPCASCPDDCFQGRLCLRPKNKRQVRSVTNETMIE